MHDPKKFLFLLPFFSCLCSLKYAKERWKLKRWHESYALKKWKIARRIDRATSKEKRSDWCGTHAHMLNLYKTGNVRAREPQTQSANWQLILLNCSMARVWCLYLHFTISHNFSYASPSPMCQSFINMIDHQATTLDHTHTHRGINIKGCMCQSKRQSNLIIVSISHSFLILCFYSSSHIHKS